MTKKNGISLYRPVHFAKRTLPAMYYACQFATVALLEYSTSCSAGDAEKQSSLLHGTQPVLFGRDGAGT